MRQTDRQGMDFVAPKSEFASLYRAFYAWFYFAPVNQEMIQSLFSKVSRCILSADPPGIDASRIGQYRSKSPRVVNRGQRFVRKTKRAFRLVEREEKKRKVEPTP